MEPQRDPFPNQVSDICTTGPLDLEYLQFGLKTSSFAKLLFNFAQTSKRAKLASTLLKLVCIYKINTQMQCKWLNAVVCTYNGK